MNSVFSQNEAVQGGAVYNHYSSIIVSSSVLYQNSANIGGAIYNNSSSITLNNVTISQNAASGNAGAIKNVGNAGPKIRNTIIWGNMANVSPNMSNSNGCTPIVANSIIEGGGSNTNNNINPQFTQVNDGDGADNIWMTNDDGLRLKPCSQAINAGANMYLPSYVTLDIRGKNRFSPTSCGYWSLRKCKFCRRRLSNYTQRT